ncbi:MAG TPA: VOC family protein [Roseomonas sp.]|jgi:catechol 2,3-dioxygenase-like lactoylglutathione lyase family enzyme
MPNPENLRKQAKQFLRWHRDRHYPVAAQIRALLPRYRDLTDEQVLASHFRLNDAQELVARKLGFGSWEALLKGLPTMSGIDAEADPRPVLLQAEPQLFVRDIAAACAFYAGTLGFTVAFTYGEPPFYAQVARDGARLNLRCVAEPPIDPALRAREDLLSASITLEDAKPLFLEYQAAGAPFHQTLRTEPWGARSFIIRDPDGNLILFAGKGGQG